LSVLKENLRFLKNLRNCTGINHPEILKMGLFDNFPKLDYSKLKRNANPLLVQKGFFPLKSNDSYRRDSSL